LYVKVDGHEKKQDQQALGWPTVALREPKTNTV